MKGSSVFTRGIWPGLITAGKVVTRGLWSVQRAANTILAFAIAFNAWLHTHFIIDSFHEGVWLSTIAATVSLGAVLLGREAREFFVGISEYFRNVAHMFDRLATQCWRISEFFRPPSNKDFE